MSMPKLAKNFSVSTSGSPQRWQSPSSGTTPGPVKSSTSPQAKCGTPREVVSAVEYSAVMLRKPLSPNPIPPLAAIDARLPSPSKYSPPCADTVNVFTSSRRITLITPAIASEPYWAEAPSRSTSIRSMASAGNDAKSTACAPWFTVPSGANCRFTSGER